MDKIEEIKSNDEKADILEEDISRAIQVKLGPAHFVLLRYQLEPMVERIGLLGDHSILYVTILNQEGIEETFSFFAKFFPKLEAQAKFAEGIGAFKKEMFVYELLDEFRASNIDLASSVTARCFLARYNKYFILENLVEEDYQVVNKHVFLDYKSVLVVLQSLARLHASSIIFEERHDRLLLDKHPDNFEESFFNDRENFANAKGVDASIKCVIKEIDIFDFPPKLKSGKKFSDVAEKICYKIYELAKPSKRYRNVLAHGDLWATNCLLKYDVKTQSAISCKFVDFQCGRYVPPSQDVLSVLYLTTSREFRKNYLYQVIGMYYSYLEKYLKVSGIDVNSILTFSDFMESCEEQKLFAIVQTAIYFPLILISNDLIEVYFSDEELNERALFEDRSCLVLAHMEKDEAYKCRLIDSIQDLKDYCEYL